MFWSSMAIVLCFSASHSENALFFPDLLKYIQLATVHGSVGQCGDAAFPGIFVRLDDPLIFDFIKLVVDFGLDGMFIDIY